MKTAPRSNRELLNMLSDSLFMFANLVANRAGSFACRLAGSGTFAAAAGTQRFVEHSFVNCLYMFFHINPPWSFEFFQHPLQILLIHFTLFSYFMQVPVI